MTAIWLSWPRRALRAAGDRALALSAGAATAHYYEEAFELAADSDSDRPFALLHYGKALHLTRDERRFDVLDEPHDALVAAGETEAAAAVQSSSAPTETRAVVLSVVARFRALFGDVDLDDIHEALQAARAVGRDDLQARNLITLGGMRFVAGELTAGIGDIERGIELAKKAGSVFDVSRGYTNLATFVDASGDLVRSNEYAEEGLRYAELFGVVDAIRFNRGNLIMYRLYSGEWADAERAANEFLAESEASPHYMDFTALIVRAFIALSRDRLDDADDDVEEALVRARAIEDPQALQPALSFAAFFHAEVGEVRDAQAALDELSLPDFAEAEVYFAAATLGDTSLREHLPGPERETPWDRAARAVLDLRWGDAADLYERIGDRPTEALARLRAAQAFLDAGSRADANEELRKALAFWRSVGATRYIREGEALMAASA